ncbi:heavy metal-binding domain-containing protein [Bacillus sp. JJ864]|uniref:heavy metal-binding domain-containing protein n=1 Tax=Bacillus sp. JJ864 TaxID=3122975 RepID=UPI002FFF676D
MIVTTTSVIQGKEIIEYIDIVNGEAIMGANIVRDVFASVRDGMLMVAVSGTAVRV